MAHTYLGQYHHQQHSSLFGLLQHKYYRLRTWKQPTLISHVLETGKSKIEVPADSMSGEALLPGAQMAIYLLCSHVVKDVREPSGVSFMKALVTSQCPLLMPPHWGLGLQDMNFEGYRHSMYSTHHHLPVTQFENYVLSHRMLAGTLRRMQAVIPMFRERHLAQRGYLTCPGSHG